MDVWTMTIRVLERRAVRLDEYAEEAPDLESAVQLRGHAQNARDVAAGLRKKREENQAKATGEIETNETLYKKG